MVVVWVVCDSGVSDVWAVWWWLVGCWVLVGLVGLWAWVDCGLVWF